MQLPTYSYYREIFKDNVLPLAYLDMDLLNENIQQVKKRVGNKNIRIASKSIRAVAILKHILDDDVQFQGIMAYHPEEAVFLSKQGFDNILIAYPFWHPTHISNVLAEIKQGKQLIAMVDSSEHLAQLDQVAQKENTILPVCIDMDMSSKYPGIHFGVLRSQLRQADQVNKFAQEIQKHSHLKLTGLMGYEAQIAGLQDRGDSLLMNIAVPFLKRISLKEVQEKREAAIAMLPTDQLSFVNGGGTGSLETTSQENWITEVAAGSAFFSPSLFDGYNAFKHRPAAGFAIRITRKPEENIYTCLGGGYPASGSAGKDKLPKPYLPQGAELLENEGAGEVQTPIQYSGNESLSIGDPVFFRHAKAGELCERFNHLFLISDGKIIDKIPTYRGEGMNFL